MLAPAVTLISLLAMADFAAGQVFAGCVESTGLPSVAIPISGTATGAPDCAAKCAGNTYNFFNPQSGACHCSTVPALANGLVAGASDVCNTGQFVAGVLASPYQFTSCYSAISLNQGDSGSPTGVVGGPDTCFKMCGTMKTAVLWPQDGKQGNYECYCANLPLTSTKSPTCDTHTYYVYGGPVVASGVARRRLAAEKRQAEQLVINNPHCPSGFQACLINANSKQAYECLKTDTELESCGGCRFGHYGRSNATAYAGIDCTTLRGVHTRGASCSGGECVFTRCRRGYKLNNGVCE